MLFMAMAVGIRSWGSQSKGSGSQTDSNDGFEQKHIDKLGINPCALYDVSYITIDAGP